MPEVDWFKRVWNFFALQERCCVFWEANVYFTCRSLAEIIFCSILTFFKWKWKKKKHKKKEKNTIFFLYFEGKEIWNTEKDDSTSRLLVKIPYMKAEGRFYCYVPQVSFGHGTALNTNSFYIKALYVQSPLQCVKGSVPITGQLQDAKRFKWEYFSYKTEPPS